MKVFYKLIVPLWVHKFAISVQYLKKNVKDEVDFLSADKHQRCLQIDVIILGVCGQACPNLLK